MSFLHGWGGYGNLTETAIYKLHVCKDYYTNIFALGFLPRDTAKHHRENIIDILKR